MDACEHLQERYTEYLYHELSASEHQEIEQHLQDCPSCREELEGLRKTFLFLKREAEFAPTREMEEQFIQGVYRKIAANPVTDKPDIRTTFRDWLARIFPAPNLVRVPLMMAASLVLGIWIGASQFDSTPVTTEFSQPITRQTAQERLALQWQQEMQVSLNEAQTQRYLRNDPMAAMEQYARFSESGPNDKDLLAQVQAEKQEMIRRAGI